MKCHNCQFENPDGMKFCGECGCEIKSVCPQCHFINPPHFKFCGECGARLATQEQSLPKALSLEEQLDKIQRYLPKGVTEKILAQRGRIEGERKHITVLFCDLVGFTPMVEKLGYEDAYSLMDQVYEILIHKVQEYGGTVNEMTGDGVMALFGAPIALEDAPQRAIRSAMAIHRAITSFSNEMKDKGKDTPSLKMRIGINTGHVVVGTLGNDLRVEFKAVGDTVNVASRMESMAEPGTTYITEDTFKLAEGFFRFEAIGEKSVKGKEAFIKVYRVIAPSSLRTRFDVNAEHGLTSFVGRQRELELLIDGYERSKKGFGQVVSIVSEPGAGKSRLLYEFRKLITNEELMFLEAKCLSFCKNIAYYPIVELLKASFNLMQNDNDLEKAVKVKTGLKALNIDEESTLKFLLELLSVKDSGFDKLSMSPESKKDRTMEALRRIALKKSELMPLVLVFEDLHWIDKSSETYLKYLIESLTGAQILLVCTYRPEYIQPWRNRSNHNHINLNRLSDRESITICSNILSAKNLGYELEELILSKSEGIPLYIEELIKCLKDLKAIQKIGYSYQINLPPNFTIPSTIQDIISVRVDSLSESAKSVLQLCSVIEKEFSYKLLKHILKFNDNELLSILTELIDSEIIFERGVFPDNAYVFKHALAKDIVYNSILTKRKKRIHEEIGDAFEELYSDCLSQYYGVLAEHYIESENYIKASNYSKLAAKNSERAGSFIDAIKFTESWVQSLENQMPSDNLEKRLVDARTTLGFYHLQLQHYEKAKQSIAPIIDMALKHKYKKRLPQVYALLGIYSLFIREDFSAAAQYLTKSIQLAEETNNYISLLFSNHYLGHVYIEICEFEKGYNYIKKALYIAEIGDVLWSIALHKACISLNVYCFQGKIGTAYKLSKEAIILADRSGDILSKSEAYTSCGICCLYMGYLNEAEKYLLAGNKLSIKADLRAYKFLSSLYLGELYMMWEDYTNAQIYFSDSINLEGEGCFGESAINIACILYFSVNNRENMKESDLHRLENYILTNNYMRYDGIIRNRFAITLENFGDKYFIEAAKWFEKAIDVDKNNGLKFELGFDYLSYGNYFKRKGDVTSAKKMMGNALKIFKECGAKGWINLVDTNLASI